MGEGGIPVDGRYWTHILGSSCVDAFVKVMFYASCNARGGFCTVLSSARLTFIRRILYHISF